MRVRELLRDKRGNVVTTSPASSVASAARLLMQHGIGGLPVVADDGRVVGILSERDIVKALDERVASFADTPVERVMHRPAPVCDADTPLQDIMSSMTRQHERHIVVMEGGAIVGVVSVGDLVKHRLGQLETETGVLRDYVAARRASS
jgi:CBS domain-containing protein